MSEAHIEPAPVDTSEEKDDEEIVALLPPSQPPDDRKGDHMSGNNLRRTPGPNSMRRPNENVSDECVFCLPAHLETSIKLNIYLFFVLNRMKNFTDVLPSSPTVEELARLPPHSDKSTHQLTSLLVKIHICTWMGLDPKSFHQILYE